MAAGLTDKLMDMSDVVAMIDARTPATKVRGPYKKKGITANTAIGT
jgi:hypothetical protein